AGSISRYPQGDSKVVDDTPLSWDEIQALVAQPPEVEPFFNPGKDGPRRGFPLHTDRGAIAKQRERLNEIWLRNQILEGNYVEHDRALRCGELFARKCEDCGTVSCDGKKNRRNCKQRMHPLCLGVNARLPFYRGESKTKLDNEDSLSICVVALGSFYLGDTPLQWRKCARQVVGKAYAWLPKLTRRRDCPDGVANSFSGFRADLHQGYLTLDLVLAGPTTFGAAQWLREQLGELLGDQEVGVEVIPCKDAQDTVDTFGNLMSSAFVYNDPDECQALMEAFRGRHLIQARGRFYSRKASGQDGCEEVSIDNHKDLLETSSHEEEGSPPPKCPECGGKTHPVGWLTGNWQRARGKVSGEDYWLYLDPIPSGGGE
ncbi:MAG TPA: hypothetical protein VFA32_21255, partial [Dehalococcoidia bacterium]|nr:hypothetical protein [Dehalococcoidia bacterium]